MEAQGHGEAEGPLAVGDAREDGLEVAPVSSARRVVQDGHQPRPLQEKATRRASSQFDGGKGKIERDGDDASDCERVDGTGSACGLFQIVTDFMGKPTAMLSERDHGKISSVATYDAFGTVNRGVLVKLAEQNGKTSLGSTLFAVGSQEQSQARILMDQMPASWFRVNIDSSEVYYSDEPPGYGWTDWSPAVIGTCQKDIEAELSTSGEALTTRVVEYRRSEAGVPYVFTNMRFPGQWYDPETDLHENWHRFYNPDTGMYLSPEPMLQSPTFTTSMAERGMQVPTYAYANNNPLRYVDPTGLDVLVLYGDPMFRGVDPFTRSSYEDALRAYFGQWAGESDPSKVYALSAEGGFSPGALGEQPSGGPWSHVIYFGHGLSNVGLSLGNGNAAFATQFARWFGGRSPRQLSIHGCDAGGPDAPFRIRLQQLLPRAVFGGVPGPVTIVPYPTLAGAFGGFRSVYPPYPNQFYPSWLQMAGWSSW